jgi:hypothetical protein
VTIKAAATADERLTILIMGTSMSCARGRRESVALIARAP